jgi:hypothetical protein
VSAVAVGWGGGLIAGCISPIEKYYMRPLYDVQTKTVETVSGKTETKELTIYKTSWGGRGITMITAGKGEEKAICFLYSVGDSQWTFANTLDLNINGKVTTLKADEKTSIRQVLAAQRLNEAYYFFVPINLLKEFRNIQTLKFGIEGKIITIDEVGISKIREFLAD